MELSNFLRHHPDHAPGVEVMGMWYTQATLSGAEAINHLQHGISSANVKEFVVLSLLAAVSSRKAIQQLLANY